MKYPAGTPTQPEMIAVALSKLRPTHDDVFADIGCGSGSVSIAASRLVRHVYAIDSSDEAIRATQDNVREHGITNVSVQKGGAAQLLAGLDIDCAFVGGSKNIDQVLEILIKSVPRFAVSAVRLETAVSALQVLRENNSFRELLQIQISRGSELAGGTMLKPENPIFLIVGGSC